VYCIVDVIVYYIAEVGISKSTLSITIRSGE